MVLVIVIFVLSEDHSATKYSTIWYANICHSLSPQTLALQISIFPKWHQLNNGGVSSIKKYFIGSYQVIHIFHVHIVYSFVCLVSNNNNKQNNTSDARQALSCETKIADRYELCKQRFRRMQLIKMTKWMDDSTWSTFMSIPSMASQ